MCPREADFLSLVYHELRSPLASVVGAAETLQLRWPDLTAEQRDSILKLIVGEATRLSSLVDDILDTSRVEAGTFSYRFEDVDVSELVAESVEAATASQQDVTVVAVVDGELPVISGDHGRLRQVLGNLIDNAAKYSSEGGEVEVRASATDGGVEVSVRDAGPGIPSEAQARIFEKFGRADTAMPGTGLGLFIARAIAEAHGGMLDVSSNPPEGATFVLTLPASI